MPRSLTPKPSSLTAGHGWSSLRLAALVLWAVGVQVHEALCTAGFVVLVASFVPSVGQLTRARLRVWWPLGAWVSWSLLGPLLVGHLPTGAGLARLIDWLALPLVAVAIGSLGSGQRRLLLLATFGTLVVSCVVAALQHVGVWPAAEAMQWLGSLRVPYARVYERIGQSDRFMAGGLLFHRLKFAHVSGVVVLAAVALASRQRMLWVAAAVGFVAVWAFPAARMGAVAMTIGASVAAITGARHRGRAVLGASVAAVLGVGLVAAVPSIRDRFLGSLSSQGSGERTEHLRSGLRALESSPIVGVGAGRFTPSSFPREGMPEHVRDNVGKAHNQFLSIAAESGVVGLALFVVLLVTVARRGSPLTWGALAHFVVLSLAHDPLFQVPYSLALVSVLGAGLCGAPGVAVRRQEPERSAHDSISA